MEAILQILRQVSTIFKKMSPIQRTNFALLLSILVIAVVSLTLWASREDYTLLYGNISQRDAAAIKQKLDERKIPHRVQGNAIYVPGKDVYEMRLLLAGEGLPQGDGVGYEIFDKSNFAMTDYMQNLNYKRALEGELSRTISSLRGISGCRVHLAIPKQNIFGQEKDSYTASIVLNVANGAALGKEQIGGIVHLVASSVEGLEPERVTVIDNRGHLLSSVNEDSQSGLSAKQLDARKNVEDYLEKKAESMLLAILGPGKAIVRVNAEMNFDKVEKTAEIFDPDSAVPRTEVRTEESVKDSAAAAGEEATAVPSDLRTARR
ncbi:MAG: flagellar M-ring protein FliF [Candidatus Omnitrophica bacterium]|nr:flagellar M-ring protein FliF [Candidatus Omnitrophota bacterium]